MKKSVFIILLCMEWLFATVTLKTLFKPSFIYALLMVGINTLIVWGCGAFIRSILYNKDFDYVTFIQNGVLIINAVALLILCVMSIILYYAI